MKRKTRHLFGTALPDWLYRERRPEAASFPAIYKAVFPAAVFLVALLLLTGPYQASFAVGSSGRLGHLEEVCINVSKDIYKVTRKIHQKKILSDRIYKLKSGTKITKKTIARYGGPGKFFRIYRIKKGDPVYKRIKGKSYRENGSVKLSDLRYIKTLYYDFDGKVRAGEIIVNRSISEDTRKVFRELYDIKYEIRKMHLIDDYYTDGKNGTDADNASMNDDNTSGFNYRIIAGTSTLSMHGYGRAIDVNPFENPWCPGGKLYHNQARSAEYADRGINTGVRKAHMIFQDSEITRIFKRHGFRWLGETGTRDYQHFEK